MSKATYENIQGDLTEFTAWLDGTITARGLAYEAPFEPSCRTYSCALRRYAGSIAIGSMEQTLATGESRNTESLEVATALHTSNCTSKKIAHVRRGHQEIVGIGGEKFSGNRCTFTARTLKIERSADGLAICTYDDGTEQITVTTPEGDQEGNGTNYLSAKPQAAHAIVMATLDTMRTEITASLSRAEGLASYSG